MVARESMVYFRKSKSLQGHSNLMLCSFCLGFMTFHSIFFATTVLRSVFGCFPQAFTTNVGLPCIDLKLKLEYIISFLLLVSFGT